MISMIIGGFEGLEGICGGTGIFSGFNSSFLISTEPASVAPQFLQNLSSGLIFSPHFEQKLTIRLISVSRFLTLF